jgi:hypothetical protein
MGKLLDELLKEIPDSDITVQVKEICARIWEEEKRTMKHTKALPEGANVFLALEVKPRSKGEISYVTLERDPLEEFIAVYYSIRLKHYRAGPQEIPLMPKKVKAHKLEERSAKKIVAEFAKLVKFYRGE